MPLAKTLIEKETRQAVAGDAPRVCSAQPLGTMAVRGVNRAALSGIEMNEKLLSDLSEKLAAMAGGNPAQDFQRNARALLASAFARLDLVSREEYDVQAQVLARAREKLEVLERRVAELERARGASGPG
jgi:BMFP domain-containing protein YqiC